MAQWLWFLLILVPHLAAAIVFSSSLAPAPSSLPGCPSKCGGIDIPYPFGIGAHCAWQGEGGGFTVRCNESSTSPTPRLYIGENIEIINISVQTGEMYAYTPVAHRCYSSNTTIESSGTIGWEVNSRPLRISLTRNAFTAIGCSTVAYVEGTGESTYFTGCISYCEEDFVDNEAKDGQQCTGLGCCQTSSVPAKLESIEVNWGSDTATDLYYPSWNYSPCSYAFVAAKGWENGSCQVRQQASATSGKHTGPACVSAYSECVNMTEGDGYLCNCSKGYQGNPYIDGGCQDIDECNPEVYTELYRCAKGSTCKNTPGDYKCKCNKFWHKGDGRSDKGCRSIIPAPAIAAGATVVSLLLLVLLQWYVRKERKQRQRRGFFDKNGGKLLEGVEINVYTEEQMKKMTVEYSNPIGKGNFGNVFLGTLEDNQRVAVKCAVRDDGNEPREGGDFVHEILFQFQMRHKNLGRLVGCCLETNLPMLVFEFVSSGSLFDVLHGTLKQRTLTMLERIDIAIGSAEALAYMHSHCGHNKRIHGDVKSANILLDDELSPKVSDFGSSKVMSSKSRYVKFVASDMNYVDPVYLKTYRFTEKSDVYSFGVVLLELITRKAVRYDGNNSLHIDFVKCCKVEGNGRKMYDQDILAASDDAKSHLYMECLDIVGAVAVRCLEEDMDERPDMAQVLEELNLAKKIFSRSDSYSVMGQSHAGEASKLSNHGQQSSQLTLLFGLYEVCMLFVY